MIASQSRPRVLYLQGSVYLVRFVKSVLELSLYGSVCGSIMWLQSLVVLCMVRFEGSDRLD